LQAERGGLAEPILADPTVATTEKADRILARVASKLQTDLSVEYTVNQLIQEARDPERLSTIFVG
jgi:ataxia telangiectasia mutated family protein